MGWHRRLARLLLPASFFERWGEEMCDAFRHDLERHRAGRYRRGALARAAVGLAITSLDVRTRGLRRRLRQIAAWRAAAGTGGRRRAEERTMLLVWSDLVQAVRTLRRRPGFVVVAVSTLALGIGANTAIFSIVDRLLLAPLPFPEGDRIAVVYNAPNGGGGFGAASEVVYQFLADRAAEDAGGSAPAFEAVAALGPGQANVGGSDDPERAVVSYVTASFFRVAGTPLRLGRGFSAEEDRTGADPVAVISYGLWQRRFGGDPSVIGRSMPIDGRPHRITGVMPEGFELLWARVDLWLPLRVDPAGFDATTPKNNNRVVVVRTRGGIDAAASALPGLVGRLRERYPDAVGEDQALRLVGLREHLSRRARPTLMVLLGAVGLVLLIACANLASLMLVRAEDRHAEMSVRVALGAGAGRIVRQLMVESAVLAGGGALVGVGLAVAALELVRPLAPAGLPIPPPGSLDARVLLFTLGLAGLTVMLFGAVPAVSASRQALRGALEAGARRATGAGGVARRALVVAEVAVAVVLLVGSGLLIHSLWRLGDVDPGFASDHRVTADLSLARERHPDDASIAATLREVLDRAQALPIVRRAAAVQWLPLLESPNWAYEVEGRTDEDLKFADYNLVTPAAFETLGIPILAGRGFTWHDLVPGAAPVVVISRSIAERVFPGESAVGKRLNVNIDRRLWREVVGVVGEVRNRSLARAGDGLLYFPPVTLPFSDPSAMSLVVEGEENVAAGVVAADLRRIVQEIDPSAPLGSVSRLSRVLDVSTRERRFVMSLLTLFAGIAVVLAAGGLYGVLSQVLARRTREIGLRMALGAARGRVAAMIARETGAMIGLGLMLGVAGAVLASRLLDALLYEVEPRDLPTYAAAAVALLVVAAAVTWLPVRRATTIDPVVALREE